MQKYKRNKEKKRVQEEILFLHDETEMDTWLAQFDSDIAFFEEYYQQDMEWYRREPLPEGVTINKG